MSSHVVAASKVSVARAFIGAVARARAVQLFAIAELLCLLLTHGPLRTFVAVIAGQDVGGASRLFAGAAVVLAQMLLATLLPIGLIASIALTLIARSRGRARASMRA